MTLKDKIKDSDIDIIRIVKIMKSFMMITFFIIDVKTS
jgi:hypothetical protein